ncbi:thermonuclease family protein [Planctomycetota bacterium]|nr:thermonuclease family protein [Planctomycetota bacterium]
MDNARGILHLAQNHYKNSHKSVTVDEYYRRRLIKRTLIATFALICIITFSILDHHHWFLYQGSEFDQLNNRHAYVTKIIDGDTIIVTIPDLYDELGNPLQERIRLWGLDTPEIQRTRADQIIRKAEPYSGQATQLTRQLSEGKTIQLKLQKSRLRGQFGRLLAYIILPDGSDLGEHLLISGFAAVELRWHHQKLQRYQLLEQSAKRGQVGMWDTSK